MTAGLAISERPPHTMNGSKLFYHLKNAWCIMGKEYTYSGTLLNSFINSLLRVGRADTLPAPHTSHDVFSPVVLHCFRPDWHGVPESHLLISIQIKFLSLLPCKRRLSTDLRRVYGAHCSQHRSPPGLGWGEETRRIGGGFGARWASMIPPKGSCPVRGSSQRSIKSEEIYHLHPPQATTTLALPSSSGISMSTMHYSSWCVL